MKNIRMRKIAAWTVFMTAAGSILGATGSYAKTWYGQYLEPGFLLAGACIGVTLGVLFSRKRTAD